MCVCRSHISYWIKKIRLSGTAAYSTALLCLLLYMYPFREAYAVPGQILHDDCMCLLIPYATYKITWISCAQLALKKHNVQWTNTRKVVRILALHVLHKNAPVSALICRYWLWKCIDKNWQVSDFFIKRSNSISLKLWNWAQVLHIIKESLYLTNIFLFWWNKNSIWIP